MENLKIRHKEFKNVQELDSGLFKGEFKDKIYEIRNFIPKSEDFFEMEYSIKRINNSGVKSPKLFVSDSKTGYLVRSYLEGESLAEYMAHDELTDDMYEQLFKNAYLAKLSQITLNYEPDKWILIDGVLYYTYPHAINYVKEKDLADHYIRLWFNTKERAEFLRKKGINVVKNDIKDEYFINKEIVLTVCKYYR